MNAAAIQLICEFCGGKAKEEDDDDRAIASENRQQNGLEGGGNLEAPARATIFSGSSKLSV